MTLASDTATIAIAVPGFESTAAETTSAQGDLPAGIFALVVERGPDAGSRFILAGKTAFSIGRDSRSDIFLDDVTVSRSHAVLQAEGARWQLHDSGSLNGTYINAKRCTSQLLNAGDVITVGKFRFLVARGGDE